ncbi:homoserine dehydrogenase [Streptococcus cuniculipharyngis]|uniref:Homoserine dehydrogenase n=1 Tax=Streptococcus cuniculipharyngis TaxID=1562651 RepID=A0A5C5SGD6_9STRE|nr:homoserine dehydrogenase [Streptococcus cuniculipharyngis]
MTIKIGVLGFGTVAQGLPKLLAEKGLHLEQMLGESFAISKVLVRNQEKREQLANGDWSYDFVTDIKEIIADDSIQVVIELMGRIEPAKTYISQALKAGKHVITANKDLLALYGSELSRLAEDNQVAFYYEGAVAGGIPILRTLANVLALDKVERILGILNGTSNFMLTKMIDEGWTYERALAEAQALGYAESDPTNDVEGIDAAYKASILAQFGFGMRVDFDQVSHQGIRQISPVDITLAQKLGYAIKLLADVRQLASGLSVSVAPSLIPLDYPLASVNGVMNGVFVESLALGQSMYYGPGAGQLPTALSVMADLWQVGRVILGQETVRPFNPLQAPAQLARQEDILSIYYILIEQAEVSKFNQLGLAVSQSLALEGYQAYLTPLISLVELEDRLNQVGLNPISLIKVLGE